MDDSKKPGSRDISDLKARLGLTKPGAASPAPPSSRPSTGGYAPVPPPPGAPMAAPFSREAQPMAPPLDPRRDPFAQQQAASLAAYYGIGQVLPGSAEGVGDVPISKPQPWGRLGLVAAIAAVILAVGYAAGRVVAGRVNFNMTIDQALRVRDEVETMSKQLAVLVDTVNQSKETVKGNVDLEMTEKLGSLRAGMKTPDTQKLFHTNYYFLEDIVIERLFTYYNDTIQLYDEIAKHAKKTEADKEGIINFLKAGAARGDKNYGVTLDLTGAIPLAHFVEVGQPLCPKPGQVDCNAGELKGFKYRTDSGAGWGERPVKGKPGEIVVPIQATPFFKSVAAGSPDVFAVKDYARRVANIRVLLGKLVASQKDVLADLKRAADRPKVFTF